MLLKCKIFLVLLTSIRYDIISYQQIYVPIAGIDFLINNIHGLPTNVFKATCNYIDTMIELMVLFTSVVQQKN